MKLLLYGVSGNTVSLEDRGKYLVDQKTAAQHLSDLKQYEGVEGIVLFSNAFRTEYYLHVDETIFSHGDFLRYLSEYSGKAIGDVILETYSKFNADAIRHLLYVLSGMDSEEEDESDLMHKVEEALEASRIRGDYTGLVLDDLFEKAIHFSSQMQALPAMAPLHSGQIGSVVRAFISAWKNLSKKRFLLMGTGEEVSHLSKTLFRMGARHIAIANTEKEASESLTGPLNLWARGANQESTKRAFFPVDLHNFLYHFSASDGIIVSSSQFQDILTPKLTQQIQEIRPSKKKQLMIDLSHSIKQEFVEQEPFMTVYSPEEVLSSAFYPQDEEENARKVFEETVELEAENFFSWYLSVVDMTFTIKQSMVLESMKDKAFN